MGRLCGLAIEMGVTPWELAGVERTDYLFKALLEVSNAYQRQREEDGP